MTVSPSHDPAIAAPAGPPPAGRWPSLRRTLGFPLLMIALAIATSTTGVDLQLSDPFYDPRQTGFPLRHDPLMNLVGHQVAKDAIVLVWIGVLVVALVSQRLPTLARWRRVLWATVAAMALGPTLVVLMKEFNTFPCPWSLQRYGGFVVEPAHWFCTPERASRCFPSGHSAGGFALFAGVFAADAAGRPGLARLAFWAALAIGIAFSVVRVAQGAHFASHAMWSAAIDWLAAGLVFFWLSPGSEPWAA